MIYVFLGTDPGDGWTSEEAGGKCGIFTPDDKSHVADYPFTNLSGELTSATLVYKSNKLAKQLPKSEFRSFKKSQPPGTFAASFTYNGNFVQSCAVHTNLELDL